jgi:hypothetical protein
VFDLDNQRKPFFWLADPDSLRKPFFWLAVGLIVVALLLDIGNLALPRAADTFVVDPSQMDPDVRAAFLEQQADFNRLQNQEKPPGLGVPSLGMLDAIALFTVGLMALSMLVTQQVFGRIQGIISLIFSILLLLSGLGLILLVALPKLLLMISLLLSVPFGTLAYLALFGFFNRGGAAAILTLTLLLKLGFGISLVVAQQRFLQNKGLIFIVILVLVGNVLVSFLHGIVPIFLVSITDAIAAIIVAILAVIWGILLLIGAVIAIIKALRPSA